jgi:hypothetical protein
MCIYEVYPVAVQTSLVWSGSVQFCYHEKLELKLEVQPFPVQVWFSLVFLQFIGLDLQTLYKAVAALSDVGIMLRLIASMHNACVLTLLLFHWSFWTHDFGYILMGPNFQSGEWSYDLVDSLTTLLLILNMIQTTTSTPHCCHEQHDNKEQ